MLFSSKSCIALSFTSFFVSSYHINYKEMYVNSAQKAKKRLLLSMNFCH